MTATYLPRPVLPAHVRRRCEETVERILALLDACDPDPDSEDDGEAGPLTTLADILARDSDDSEPSLAVPEPGVMSGCHWTRAGLDSNDCEGDLADSADDREADPVDEGEPTLGATTTCNQLHAWDTTGWH